MGEDRPVPYVRMADRRRPAHPLAPEGAEVPEPFEDQFPRQWRFKVRRLRAEPRVPLTSGFALVVRRLVPDDVAHVSGEFVGKLSEKFRMLFAAPVTWSKIQPSLSIMAAAVLMDSSGFLPS